MDRLKIATWNIRQGGRKAIQQIVGSLLHHRADIIVLTEYKDNEAGKFLISSLKRKGWHDGTRALSLRPFQRISKTCTSTNF